MSFEAAIEIFEGTHTLRNYIILCLITLVHILCLYTCVYVFYPLSNQRLRAVVTEEKVVLALGTTPLGSLIISAKMFRIPRVGY